MSTPSSSQRRTTSSRGGRRPPTAQEYKPPVAKVRQISHDRPWDATATVTKPTIGYNSLTDPSLAHYYGQRKQRDFLQQSGIIAPDGRIVHTSKAYSRVVVAEQVFGTAEDEDYSRNEEEYRLRMQLRARTATSREKMQNDTKVNKMRIAEHDAILRRKKERQQLEDRCWHGDYQGRHHARLKPRIDWKTLQYLKPGEQTVTTSVRPAGTESRLTSGHDSSTVTNDDDDDDSSVSSYHRRTRSSSPAASSAAASTPSRSRSSHRSDHHDDDDDAAARSNASASSSPSSSK